jgi:capsular polysaccharide biosynthesis protein
MRINLSGFKNNTNGGAKKKYSTIKSRISKILKRFLIQYATKLKENYFAAKIKMKCLRDKLKEKVREQTCNKKQLTSYKNLITKINSSSNLLSQSSTVKVKPPKIINASKNKILEKKDVIKKAPAVMLFKLKNAKVFGRSNLIIYNKHLLHHDLVDLKTDYTSEELHKKIRIFPQQKTALIQMPKNKTYKIQSAATFLDAGSTNYAHWLTEILPKILLFEKNKETKMVPILIDAGLPANIISSLKKVINHKRPCYIVDENVSVNVKNLFVISPAGYVPFEPRPGTKKKGNDGIFNKHAIKNMRESLLKSRKCINKKKQKIYLKRNSHYRKLKNEQEIICVLIKFGFKIIEPDKLSFFDQIKTFWNSSVIVGPTGAAFANLIFSGPATKIIILAAANPLLKYGYWQNLVQTFGGQITYILGRPETNEIHSDYSIDIKKLAKEVKTTISPQKF